MRERIRTCSTSPTFGVLPLLIHGDAAFAGQGVVAEVLNLSQIPGYRAGGTIHLIINNQLGFTTPPEAAGRPSTAPTWPRWSRARSSTSAVTTPRRACGRRLAFAHRERFHKDVVIDMICYRRFGHNEGDDPSYTQPLMYKRIDERRSARKLYTELLVNRGDLTIEDAEKALEDYERRLQEALDHTRESAPSEPAKARPQPPPIGVLPHVDTAIGRDVADAGLRGAELAPAGLHPPSQAREAVRDTAQDV